MPYVYRGVHCEHPMLEAARRGVVVPGDVQGWVSPEVTPREHNENRRIHESSYTSWTYSLDEAERKAADRGGGYVILRLEKRENTAEDAWSWVRSDDLYKEDEVLLRGVRIDCEVLFGR